MKPPLLILACSGPGTHAAIVEAQWISYLCAGVAGAFVVGLVVEALRMRRTTLTMPIALGLLALHPAWTVGGGGDCGGLKILTSYMVTEIFILLMLYQHIGGCLEMRRK